MHIKNIFYYFIFILLFIFPIQQSSFSWINNEKVLFLDELLIAITFISFLACFIYSFKIKKKIMYMSIVLLIFFFMSVLSGIYNDNNFRITVLGSMDYIKNFLVIPILGYFLWKEKHLRNIYKALRFYAILFCFVAIAQELFFFWHWDLNIVFVKYVEVRYGVMRTPSLLGHPNAFGLYCLLFFIFEINLEKKFNWRAVLFLTGILFSVSRIIWLSLLIIMVNHFFGKSLSKKHVSMLIVLICMVLFLKMFIGQTLNELSDMQNVRAYVIKKSYELWEQNPLIGFGPGMYGGVVSFRYKSPIYDKYHFDSHWYEYLSEFRSLDMFWPQILVELGIVGALLFIYLLYSLWRQAIIESNRTNMVFVKGILKGCSNVTFVIVIYLFGSGLNLTYFLLTYAVIYGLALGVRNANNIAHN